VFVVADELIHLAALDSFQERREKPEDELAAEGMVDVDNERRGTD